MVLEERSDEYKYSSGAERVFDIPKDKGPENLSA